MIIVADPNRIEQAVLNQDPSLDAPSPAAAPAEPRARGVLVSERPAGARYYRIRSGDTLAAIAPRFDLKEAELVALNPGIEPTALRIGQKIRVR